MNYSPKLEEIDIEVEDGFQELICKLGKYACYLCKLLIRALVHLHWNYTPSIIQMQQEFNQNFIEIIE